MFLLIVGVPVPSSQKAVPPQQLPLRYFFQDDLHSVCIDETSTGCHPRSGHVTFSSLPSSCKHRKLKTHEETSSSESSRNLKSELLSSSSLPSPPLTPLSNGTTTAVSQPFAPDGIMASASEIYSEEAVDPLRDIDAEDDLMEEEHGTEELREHEEEKAKSPSLTHDSVELPSMAIDGNPASVPMPIQYHAPPSSSAQVPSRPHRPATKRWMAWRYAFPQTVTHLTAGMCILFRNLLCTVNSVLFLGLPLLDSKVIAHRISSASSSPPPVSSSMSPAAASSLPLPHIRCTLSAWDSLLDKYIVVGSFDLLSLSHLQRITNSVAAEEWRIDWTLLDTTILRELFPFL